MRLLILSLGLTSVLFMDGCTTFYFFSKSGTTDQQRSQDSFECKKESSSRSSGAIGEMSYDSGGFNRDFWASCLKARGYTVTKQY